jgi:hypothetical protein
LLLYSEADVSENQKISHEYAKYQPTPHDQRCEISIQFKLPDHCKIVGASVSANSWCQYFAARENAH